MQKFEHFWRKKIFYLNSHLGGFSTNSKFHFVFFLSRTHRDLNRQPLDLLPTVITTWPWKQWMQELSYLF